jgi:monoterpene epsilon-lactone hydrolase
LASDAFSTVLELIRPNFASLGDVDVSALELRAGIESSVGAMPLPDGTTIEPLSVGGVPSEWVRPGVVVAPDACVLYLHGGGYVIGSCNTHRPLASHLACRTGLPVLLVDYRLAPEHPYPAAVDDALTAYEWLLARGFEPGRIVVAGDSAGGGLTLATLLALRDRGRPQPALGVAISPWTDLTLSGESMTSMADRDPMVTRGGLQRMADWYAAGCDPTESLVSPLFADPTGLPPLLIHVGEVETLRDDAVRFADRAAKAGVDVTLEVWPEMIHVWHVLGPDVPESEAGVARIAEFVADRVGLSAPAATGAKSA